MGDWIPVEEKLPENTDDVLVTDDWDFAVAYFNGTKWMPQKGMLDASNYDGGAEITLDCEVTHWIPIPAFNNVEVK